MVTIGLLLVTGVSDNSVNVYDSLYNGTTQTTKELKEKVKINIINVQQQENGSDCGIFAIAFAKCLLEGKVNPRKHLAQYLPQGIIPKFTKVLTEHLPHVLNKVVHIQYLVRRWGKTCGRKMGQPGLKTGQVGRWGTTYTE